MGTADIPHKMEKNDRRLAYGIGVLVVGAIVMTWISHSNRAAHRAEPPKAVGIPMPSGPPSQATAPSTPQAASQTGVPAEEQHSPAEPSARPAFQPSHQADAPPASQSLVPDLSSASDEEPSPPDSDQNLSPPTESASQRVARRLKRH